MSWSRFLKNTNLLLGGMLLALLSIIAVIGPNVVPHDPFQIELTLRFQAPSQDYPLGTDHLGRCVLSRLVLGGGVSLGVSMAISALIMFVGLVIGLLAGMGTKKLDFIVMRIVDMLLAFPSLVLTLAIIGTLGPSLLSAAIGIFFSWWPIYARLVRGIVLSARGKEFVTAARLVGTSRFHLITRHILPQVLPPVLVLVSLETGTMILVFSGLGFLGLGVQPPQPEWGVMLNEARTYIFTAPHLLLAPGVAIFLTVLGFSLLGEGLRNALQIRGVNRW